MQENKTETLTVRLLGRSVDNGEIDELNQVVQDESKAVVSSPSNTARVVSFGLNNSLVAIHIIGNGVIISSLGSNEAAAAGLILSIQAVINGAIVGALLNSGYKIGSVLGKKEQGDESNQEIGTIIKLGWIVGGVLCFVAAGGFVSTIAIMPRIVAPATGKAVGDFFLRYAIGGFAEPMLAGNGMIIGRIEKGPILPLVIPFLSMALYRLPSLSLGYFFAKQLGWGVEGVAWGSTIGGVTSFLITQAWFSRKNYKEYDLYNFNIPNFRKHLCFYLEGGWKLSLQRISEWGNTATIAILVAVWSNSSLQALQPSLQVNTLVALSLQGMGQAAMMFISSDRQAQKECEVYDKKNPSRQQLERFQKLKNENKITFYKNNIAGVVLTSGFCGAIYFEREPVINLFLNDATSDQYELAESLLMYTLAGLFPDAVRIISGGILRGWDDLLYPTVVSIVVMTLLGVSIGGAIAFEDDENPLPIFWVRVIGIFLSAAINCYRFYTHITKDTQLYLDGVVALDNSPDAGQVTTSIESLAANDTTTDEMEHSQSSNLDYEQEEDTEASENAEQDQTPQLFPIQTSTTNERDFLRSNRNSDNVPIVKNYGSTRGRFLSCKHIYHSQRNFSEHTRRR